MTSAGSGATQGSTQTVTRKELRTVLLSCLVGTTVEWYDFFLYGVAAGIVFNKLFFPTPIRSWARCSPSRPSPSASSHGPWAALSSATSATGSAASPR